MLRTVSIFVIVIGCLAGLYIIISLADGYPAGHWRPVFSIVGSIVWIAGNIMVIVQLASEGKLFDWRSYKR